MKKLTAWALLLAMCVAMLAGCSTTPDPTEAPTTPPTAAPTTPPTEPATEPPTEPESGLENAYAYVKTVYKATEGTDTGKDYEVIGRVPVGEETFEITWTIEVAEGIVAEDVAVVVPNDSGMVTIDVNENASEDVAYVLVATLTDGKETKTLSWNHTLPASMDVDGLTYAEIVALAYSLADGTATEDTFRLYGTVSSIDTAWSEDYKNITVTIVVPGCEEQPIQCYRLKGDGAADLKVGDAITVEGVLKNYKGTYEFDAGCVLVGYGEHVDQKLLLKAAFALAEGASLDYPAVMTGKIVKIVTAYSEDYKNITVDMEIDGQIVQCYRLKGEGAATLAEGDVITVAGIIKNYKGTIEFDAGCQLVPNDAYHSVKNALSAYKLAEGAAQEGAKTITGTIASIDTAYSEDYKNITVTIVVAGLENYKIQCYRLKGEGAADLAVGDVITVTGTLKNYKGTYEFDAGCTLDSVN